MATREEKYREQMKALGTYDPIFEPELTTLCQLEREHQNAKKAWSATAGPKGSKRKPSVLDPHYAVIQRQRQEILTHREALGLTPKALRKLRGQPVEGPSQQEQITAKLDLIAQRVSEYDAAEDPAFENKLRGAAALAGYEDLPEAEDAIRISDRLDAELAHAVAEDMG